MYQQNLFITMGPSVQEPSTIAKIANYGFIKCRLNTSHADPEWHISMVHTLQKAGLQVMVDLSGPKIRLGELPKPLEVKIGDIVNLIFIKSFDYETEHYEIVLPTRVDLAPHLVIGQKILIDDGKVALEIVEIKGKLIKTKVTVAGKISSNKGINLLGQELPIDFLTDKDRSLLENMLPVASPEYIAASFINTADEINRLKSFITSILDQHKITDYFPKIIVKIEQQGAINNLDEIIKVVDIVMVARGDLALENEKGPVYTPFLQDLIVNKCKAASVPVMIATEMLSSMTECPLPTRAEASDVYRAVVLNQAEYVMLSNETAVGKYPLECIEFVQSMLELNNPSEIVETKPEFAFQKQTAKIQN